MSELDFSQRSAFRLSDKANIESNPKNSDVAYATMAIGKDNHLLYEPTSFEDAENLMLGNCQTVEGHNADQDENGLMLAAISTKFSPARLERTVKAFAKKLDGALNGTGLTTDGVIIGKPRVAGGFATLVTQIKLSDGQAISILFHAPDEDPAKFNADDTLFAFIFKLNHKDVTNVVAPSGGMDISIGQATMVLSNLAEKNSGPFVARKTKSAENKLEAEKLEIELEELKAVASALAEEATAKELKKDELTSQLATRNGMAAKRQQSITSLKAEVEQVAPATKEESVTPAIDEKAEFEAKANESATSPKNDLPEPTQAQKEAGNYKKGKAQFQGIDIVIENPKGSVRTGEDAETGEKWSTTMKSHYGDIVKTKGADGDKLDIFIGENYDAENAYIIDQVKKDGSFDEHKIMLGFDSKAKAEKGYLVNYDKDWQGLGNITEIAMTDLKAWVKGSTVKPYKAISGGASVEPDSNKLPVVNGWDVKQDGSEAIYRVEVPNTERSIEVVFEPASSLKKGISTNWNAIVHNDSGGLISETQGVIKNRDQFTGLIDLLIKEHLPAAESEPEATPAVKWKRSNISDGSKSLTDRFGDFGQGQYATTKLYGDETVYTMGDYEIISALGGGFGNSSGSERTFPIFHKNKNVEQSNTLTEAKAWVAKQAPAIEPLPEEAPAIEPEVVANIKEGVRFDDVTTSQGQLDTWDGMKKGDVIYSHLGNLIGTIVRKPTKTMDAALLALENGREAKIDSQRITGTSVKRLRKLNERGMQANESQLAQEKESKAKVLDEGDSFYQGGVEFEVTLVDLDESKAEITQGGYMTWVTEASDIMPNYGVIIKGLNEVKTPTEDKPSTIAQQADAIDKEGFNPVNYQKIIANRDLGLALQDSLDSAFTARLYEITNELLSNGWVKSDGNIIKAGVRMFKDIQQIGAGGNVQGIHYSLSNIAGTELYNDFDGIQDGFELTTKEIAKQLNDFADSVIEDKPEEDEVDQAASSKAMVQLVKDLEPVIDTMLDELTDSNPETRPLLAPTYREILRQHELRAADIEFSEADKVRAEFIYMARASRFLNTALGELQNGGFIPLDVNLNDLQDKQPKPQTIEEYLDGGGEGDYNAQTAYDDVLRIAKEFDVKVSSSIGPDIEGIYDEVLKIELSKGTEKATMQLMGGDAKAAMFQNGQRVSQFGKRSFFEMYSNDEDTRRERIESFSISADPEAEEVPVQPVSSPTNDAYRKLEQLSRSLVRDIASSLNVIKGIDNGTEQGYDRSLFVNSITGKIKTQAKNGNQEVVDAALDYIEAYQTEKMKKPAITSRNGVWKLRSFDEPESEIQEEPVEAPKSALDKKLDLAEQMGGANYWYGLMLRPPSIGAIPKANSTAMLDNEEAKSIFINNKDIRSVRHGAMAYAEKLSDADVSRFELIELNFESKSEVREEATITRDEIVERVIEDMASTAESAGVSLTEYIDSKSDRPVNNVLGKILRYFPAFDEEDDHPDYLVLEDVLNNTTWAELSASAESFEQNAPVETVETVVAGGDADQLGQLTSRVQSMIDNPPSNSDDFDQQLDVLVSDIENAGLMESLESKLNEAADLLSELLEREGE
jgi:hypothetical protein